MAEYRITTPRGNARVNAPEGSSREEVINIYNRSLAANRGAEFQSLQDDTRQEQRTLTEDAVRRRRNQPVSMGSYLQEVPKGLASGAAGMLESAALGLAAIAPENFESEILRPAILSGGKAVQDYLSPDVGTAESVPRKLSEAGGSFGAILGASLIPGVGTAAAATVAVGAGVGEASERARAAGATQDDRNFAAFLGIIPGAFELMPIKFLQSFGREGAKELLNGLKRVVAQGGVEAGQEAASAVMQNAIAQGVYNPEQDLLEGSGEQAAYGGAVGAIVQGLVELAKPRTRGGAATTADATPALPALPAPTGTEINPLSTLEVVEPEADVLRELLDAPRGVQDQARFDSAIAQGKYQGNLRENYERYKATNPNDSQIRALTFEEYVGRKQEEGQRLGLAGLQEPQQAQDISKSVKRKIDKVSTDRVSELLGGVNVPDPLEARAAAERRVKDDKVALGAADKTALGLASLRPEAQLDLETDPKRTAAEREQPELFPEQVRDDALGQAPRTTEEPVAPSQGAKPADLVDLIQQAEVSDAAVLSDLYAEQSAEARKKKARGLDDPIATPAEIARDRDRRAAEGPDPVVLRREQQKRDDLALAEAARAELENRSLTDAVAPKVNIQPVNEQLSFRGSLFQPKTNRRPAAPVSEAATGVQDAEPAAAPIEEPFFPDNRQGKRARAAWRGKNPQFKPAGSGASDVGPAPISSNKRRTATPASPVVPKPPVGDGLGLPRGSLSDVDSGTGDGDFTLTRSEKANRAAIIDRYAPLIKAAKLPSEKRKLVGQQVRELGNLNVTGKADEVSKPVEGVTPEVKPTKTYYDPETEEIVAAPIDPEDEAQRNRAAQAGIKKAYNKKSKIQTDIRDAAAQFDAGKAEDYTSASDKEKMLAIVSTSDEMLGTNTTKIKDFLRRFNNLPNAIDEAISRSLFGDTETQKADFDQGQKDDPAYNPLPKETAKQATQYTFTVGLNKGNATATLKWMKNNFDAKTVVEIKAAEAKAKKQGKTAGRTSDAAATIAKIQQNEQNAAREQAARDKDLKVEAVDPKTGKVVVIDKPADTAVTLPKLSPEVEKLNTLFEKLRKGISPKRLVKGERTVDAYIRENLTTEEQALLKANTREGDEVELLIMARLEEINEADKDPFIENLMLDAKEVIGLDVPLPTAASKAVNDGDLKTAFEAIAKTNPSTRIKALAKKLASLVGTTKVKIVKDLKGSSGRTAAGIFDPNTNTISLHSELGMNAHTLIHEMGHATTSATVAEGKTPAVKRLKAIYEAVKPQIGEVYGTKSIDEFVAESLGNPEFRSMLRGLQVPNSKSGNALIDLYNTLKRLLANAWYGTDTAVSREVDALILNILSPAPASRSAPILDQLASTPKGAESLMSMAYNSVPPLTDERVQDIKDVVLSTGDVTQEKLKSVMLDFADMAMIARIAKDKIPFVGELNTIIKEQGGALKKKLTRLSSLRKKLNTWRKSNPEQYELLKRLAPYASYLRVDPALDKSFYSSFRLAYTDLNTDKSMVLKFTTKDARDAKVKELNDPNAKGRAERTTTKKAGDPNPDKTADYVELRQVYDALGTEGQEIYRTARNYYRELFDAIPSALRIRLAASTANEAQQKSAFEKLSDLLQKESGLIVPYFPLSRKGKWRIQYNAVDPRNGKRVERFVEYFTTQRGAMRATEKVKKYNAASIKAGNTNPDIKIDPIVGLSTKRLSKEGVPSSSFVYQVLKILEDSKVKDPAAIDSIIELSLDAMPERSFMQGFRSRGGKGSKGIRGFIDDVTPTTGIGGQDLDFAESLKTKGRDFARQLVLLQSSAKIQGFLKKLNANDKALFKDPETRMLAEKIEQSAKFAQKPDIPRWSQMTTGTLFGWTMGGNFSSAAITIFDVGMSAQTQLSGRFGRVATWKAYGRAMKMMQGAPSMTKIMVTGPDGKDVEETLEMGNFNKTSANYDYDADDMKPVAYFKHMARIGEEQGVFNQSLSQENIEMGSGAVLENVNKVSSFMFHHFERLGREASVLAAYDLKVRDMAKDRDLNSLSDAEYAEAANWAISETEFTLGSVSAAGRSKFAQSGVGNVLLLYKRFAVSKMYMMAEMTHRAAADASPAERKIARAQLFNFFITTGLMAGAGGLPLVGVIRSIYDMFSDDEDDNFESAQRKWLGEPVWGGMADELLGVALSKRISMNSLLYRAPLVDKDQMFLFTLAEQLGGPLFGVLGNAERGLASIADGEIYRGVETMLPSMAKNLMKAGRFYTEGATTKRGDPITGDISGYSIAMQALGFAPQAYVQRLEINKNERTKQDAIDSKRSKLMRRANMARREGDRAAYRETLRDIKRFNRELPRGARGQEITTSGKGNSLERSRKSFETTSGNMRGGLTYTDYMLSSLKEYDQDIFK